MTEDKNKMQLEADEFMKKVYSKIAGRIAVRFTDPNAEIIGHEKELLELLIPLASSFASNMLRAVVYEYEAIRYCVQNTDNYFTRSRLEEIWHNQVKTQEFVKQKYLNLEEGRLVMQDARKVLLEDAFLTPSRVPCY